MKVKNSRELFRFIIAVLIIGSMSLQGCATLRARHAVPTDQINNVYIPGMPDIRVVLDNTNIQASIILLEKIGNKEAPKAMPEPAEVNLLAISGGGAGGAFGAGLLCGWTEAGNRPEFHVVTGVSTGAMSAPAAFLGSKYDTTLKDIYFESSDKDIYTKKGPLSIIFGASDSLLDTKPLTRLINHYVTTDMLKDIAKEHAKGRRLYVATAQLDAHRMVIWDMGAIASIGTPKALELFNKVLMASAAIPVAFPPVLFNVEVSGKEYDEMHVDGGTATQMFGNILIVQQLKEHPSSKGRAYIIYNSKLSIAPGTVKQDIFSVAANSISMMVSSQGIGDIFRMHDIAQKYGLDFNLAYIPNDFEVKQRSDFDPIYMKALFNEALLRAKSGYPWTKEPASLDFKNSTQNKDLAK